MANYVILDQMLDPFVPALKSLVTEILFSTNQQIKLKLKLNSAENLFP